MSKEPESKSGKKWHCKACKTAIVVIGIVLLLFLLIDPILNWTVKGKIESEIKNSENGRNAQIGHLSYSVFGNNLQITGVDILLGNNSKFSEKSINIKSECIDLDGVSWFSLLFGGGLSIGEIRLEQPFVVIQDSSSSIAGQDSTQDNDKGSLLTENELYEQLPGKFRPLKIDGVKIDDGNLIRRTIRDLSIVDDTLKYVDLSINDIQIDKEDGSNKLVFAEDFDLHIDSIISRYVSSGYELRADDINISSLNSNIEIKEISLKPFISDEEYFSHHKYRTERFIVDANNITVKDFDLSSLIKEKSVLINEISTGDFYFEVLTDKRLPRNPVETMAKMPGEMMQELDYKVSINKISLNGQINKKAAHPYFDKYAVIFFTGVKLEVDHLANYGDEECTLYAKGNIQDAAPLDVHLAIDLSRPQVNFNYYGSLGKMDAAKFNSHLIVENKLRVDSGEIEKVDFDVKVRDGDADIAVTPVYSDLKVTVLDIEDRKDKSVKIFKLRNENPNGNKKPKTGRAHYQPQPGDTFLDFVWQSLLKGLGDVVGF